MSIKTKQPHLIIRPFGPLLLGKKSEDDSLTSARLSRCAATSHYTIPATRPFSHYFPIQWHSANIFSPVSDVVVKLLASIANNKQKNVYSEINNRKNGTN